MQLLENRMEIQAADLQLIDQFRKQRNTAVLTVLFTDIKGYTDITEQYGEEFANEFRQKHDALVHPIIERDGGGQVIKNIGDSVMAIFSEPSTAVSRALEIQEAVRMANRNRPIDVPAPPLSIRIGLHSGQVTTEDRISLDVFGRHVNRAARVQSLAEGGQILMTYPVYDSAKGWLTKKAGEAPVAWQEHGAYHLKGIPDDIQIFEAYNPWEAKPMAPVKWKARKSSGLVIKAVAGAVALLMIALIALMLLRGAQGLPTIQGGGTTTTSQPASSAEVNLVDFTDSGDIQIDNQKLVVDGQNGTHIRPVIVPVMAPGRHLMMQPINAYDRNYAVLNVKPGKNYLNANLVENRLPGISRSYEYQADAAPLDATEEQDFSTFPTDGAWPTANHGKIELKISAVADAKNAKQVMFVINWTIIENSKETSGQTELVNSDVTDGDKEVKQEQVLLTAPGHKYQARFRSQGAGCQVDIDGVFAD